MLELCFYMSSLALQGYGNIHMKMDTLEEPESSPHRARVFVTSTREFERYPSKAIVPVQFVALLTSIHLTETKCLLSFSNFMGGEDPVENRYIIKLKFKDRSSERLARMTVSLLCQYFDIEFPDLDSRSALVLEDIHLERLCFSSCKALYVSKHGNYTLFLEDIKPLDRMCVINIISTDSKLSGSNGSLSGPSLKPHLKESLTDIFNNLIKINKDEKNGFKFVKLIDYDMELKKFIQERQELLLQESKPKPVDPFFVPNRMGVPYLESQNEFNSQLMTLNAAESIANTASRREDLSDTADPIEDSDASTASSTSPFLSSRSYIQTQTPERKARVPDNWVDCDFEGKKKRKLSFTTSGTPVDYERLSLAGVGTVERFQGKFVGMYPPEFSSISEFKRCTLKLYFTSFLPSSKTPDSVLIPGTNCIEIIIPTTERICELFGTLNCQSSKISNILLLNKPHPISVEIEKIMWENDETIRPGLAVWNLKNINTDTQVKAPAPLSPLVNPLRTKIRELANKDPTIEFRELQLNTFETKYVTMFGMLVSCSFDKPAFISLVFTDFTKNDIVQNYLYDRYLVDYEAKLELNEGFKAIMYKNQFESFDSGIEKIFAKRLSSLRNGRDENVSQYGIVCKMNVKVKIYNGKLNAILRDCVPVPRSQAGRIASPSQCGYLASLYQRAFDRIGESAISRYFEDYRTFFPIQRNDSHLAELANRGQEREPAQLQTAPALNEYIPDLNADVSSFDVQFTDVFQLLNSLAHRRTRPQQTRKSNTLYSCEGRIIAIEYHPSDICFHITDGRDPHRALQLHITSSKNFAYFFNGSNTYLQGHHLEKTHNQLARFLGHPFKFNITSSFKSLPGTAMTLQIWYPIECTFRELQQQLAHLMAAATSNSGSLVYGITATANPPQLLAALDGVTVKREDDNDDDAEAVPAS